MQEIAALLQKVCKELFGVDVDVSLTRPDEQFGDYATNVAMQLAKQVGKNPREIAELIAVKTRENPPEVVADISVAGPGFINIQLTNQALIVAMQAHREPSNNGEAVIETNNPNPFKAMHIGHAFNAILADTLANLIESSGTTTHRVSYHGDVGAHVGKSMYSLLNYVAGDASKLTAIPVADRNSFMSRMYAEGSVAYKEDEAAKLRIDDLAKQSFTREDPLYSAVYDTCKAWSFEQIDSTVALLGNQPIERRYLESEADTLGVDTARAHVPDVFKDIDGALLFEGSKYGTFDNIFVGSTGRGLYAARDLGLMQLKNRDYPAATKSYIVTAEEQRDYFKGVIKAAELCLPQLTDVTVNLSTGTVKLSTGKMSSRSGDVIEIAWLFEQISEAIKARGSDASPDMIASALRYEFLKVRIGSDVIFDISEAVAIQGNSGPYLQYAHARARSILSKTELAAAPLIELNAGERTLVRKLSEYPETIMRSTEELLPHHICTYLYELAQTFNRFYEQNRVIGDPQEAQRLTLVARYADVLKDGLSLLGITAPERM